MSQLPFLKNYDGQTVRELLALRGLYRDDSIVLAVESGLQKRERWYDLDSERMERAILSVTDPERVVMAIEAMDREVNNGGFSQFFQNSSKHFAPYILQALRIIGCAQYGELASSAIAQLRLPSEFNGEDCDRACTALMDQIGPSLNELDGRYYKVAEPLDDRLLSYIEQHAAEIRIPNIP